MLVHIVADYGRGDLAFSEVAQRIRLHVADSETVPVPVPPFATLAAGFCVAQLGLNPALPGTVVHHNVAPCEDEGKPERATRGNAWPARCCRLGCAREISALGGEAAAVPADVLDEEQLRGARDEVLGRWGHLDVLVNAAGGNVPGATLGGDETVFDLPRGAFGEVFDLNLVGTLLPIQVLGEAMTRGAGGCILNVSSMAAARTITRVAGYSAAKAAVDNLTRWLAVDLARKYGDGVRVNAIAPGFFIGELEALGLMVVWANAPEPARTRDFRR